jgi:hypothetical protein
MPAPPLHGRVRSDGLLLGGFISVVERVRLPIGEGTMSRHSNFIDQDGARTLTASSSSSSRIVTVRGIHTGFDPCVPQAFFHCLILPGPCAALAPWFPCTAASQPVSPARPLGAPHRTGAPPRITLCRVFSGPPVKAHTLQFCTFHVMTSGSGGLVSQRYVVMCS